MSASYKQLLENNKNWSDKTQLEDPDFFSTLENQQSPKFLWIGCSDSRVPANQITGTLPGEIFVHRNIANMVVHTDLNLMSVLQYAVEVLKVEHVIVCGHYGCGGVNAAIANNDLGLINKWLRNIKDVYAKYSEELDPLPPHLKSNRLVELNVIEQCNDLMKTSIIQKAWSTHKMPQIHGWVYRLTDGIIIELCNFDCESTDIHPVYKYNVGNQEPITVLQESKQDGE